ncbi:MAG: hypothetical protein AB8B91_09440 [Rubripirellula sp.]
MNSVTLSQEGTTYTPEELRNHFKNVANAYQMKVGSKTLKLRSQPLMFWQNTIRLQEQGALYAWLNEGRPQVLCSIFTYQDGNEVKCRHEAISLADQPLVSKLDSVQVWSPQKAGVQWNVFGGSAPPAESERRRLSQMRGIARQFNGTLKIPESQPSKLTLIPQPLVRYQAPESGVIDGAIFSLAVGTDPEIFLLVEARKDSTGSTKWHYAAARAHFHELELEKSNETVWKAPSIVELQNTRANQMPYANGSYFIFFPPKPLPSPEVLR